jgi:phenylacetate-coenzyme A ligase PaaK-like adenylate-forming protein
MNRVFGVPIINLYGSSETGHLLIEKEDGYMIPSEETALLEIDSPQSSGIGQLLVTTLTNPYLPLIRYEIGDYVEKESRGYQVHGRMRDALLDQSGMIVTTRQIDELFGDLEKVAHYQLRQNSDGDCELLLLPEKSGDSLTETMAVISERLKKRLGFAINSQSVSLITPEDSGKFRLTARFVQK